MEIDTDSPDSSSDGYLSSSDEASIDLEPPPVPSGTAADSDADEDMSKDLDSDLEPDSIDNERGRPLTAEERQAAEEDVWVHPVIQEFPGRAGEAIDEHI